MVASLSAFAPVSMASQDRDTIKDDPCIVNFVNFIRNVEPRNNSEKDRYLYVATRNELNQLNDYGFTGTFLLQYDVPRRHSCC